MAGKWVGVLVVALGVFHASAFADSRQRVTCQQLLLNGTPSIVIEITERRAMAGERAEMPWEDRLLVDSGLLKLKETIRIPTAMFLHGHHDAAGFQNALQEIGDTRAGRYLLQFFIRVARAAGRSHGIDADDVDHIAASVFVALLNGEHDSVDGEPARNKNHFGLTLRTSQYQEMIYSLLPSLHHLEHYRDRKPAPGRPKGPSTQSLWLLRFADGLGSLMQYNQGVQVRDTWEENSIAILQYLKMFSGTTSTSATGYCHELNSYQQGQRSFLISEWDALTRWDDAIVPVLPLANQSSAFDYLKTYVSQATYHDAHVLGGLLALNRREANELTVEALKFMDTFDTYLQVVRGAKILAEGPAAQNFAPSRPPRNETATNPENN